MAVAAIDYSAVSIDGKTRKIKMQNAANKVRVITLPASGRYRLTVGPLYGTTGLVAATANVMGYALGAAASIANNADSPTVADEVVRADLALAESREIVFGFVATSRPAELYLWCDLADAYVEVTFDAVEGR